ncbi:GFA family protein [Breoghania sp.]|uniref:GFA family protein n=1 Tax=Breoghania sp. TaxID=2065378 RepID=UPI0026335C5B|nr:GFA family protein [Breoghania sp.]MDJ0931619.1 GFA family protein [Breoghania sp.]
MRIEGGCHCGAITFEVDVDPEKVYVCNCTDCQVLSGSPYRIVVPAEVAKVRLSAKPKIYMKTAQSGRSRQQAFCADCGTPIYSRGVGEDEGRLALRWGTIRQCEELKPVRRARCRSSPSWIGEVNDLPASETA